jgi:cell wall-associated NlpC family hydrolase
VRPDPRTTLARADLAAEALDGVVRAARFEAPKRLRVAAPSARLLAAPDGGGEQRDQLLFGEVFDVLERDEGYAWGQAVRDGYVGYVETDALAADPIEPTHRVSALRTYAFEAPSIKARAFGPLSLNALVQVGDAQGEFVEASGAGWIPASHLAPIGAAFAEPADIAERFLGAPYLWGGRDSVGLDCSGLIQQALYAAGLACPRDSDQQAALGVEVAADGLRRGDLVFWRGHVGMMLDARRLIHANGHHMAVAVEPLAEAVGRILAKGGGEPAARRRVTVQTALASTRA